MSGCGCDWDSTPYVLCRNKVPWQIRFQSSAGKQGRIENKEIVRPPKSVKVKVTCPKISPVLENRIHDKLFSLRVKHGPERKDSMTISQSTISQCNTFPVDIFPATHSQPTFSHPTVSQATISQSDIFPQDSFPADNFPPGIFSHET